MGVIIIGRLFWKFFAAILLAQVLGMSAVGAIFWWERQAWAQAQREEMATMAVSATSATPPLPPPPRHRRGGHHRHFLPPIPLVMTLLASLLCAAGLAWYFSRPIRQLRTAFMQLAEGDLTVRIGQNMGKRRDELADLGRDFDHMSERLAALMQGQKRLLHDVSHELRSPLARLQAAIGLIRQQPDKASHNLERIEREGERMNRLVGELLTLSRLEAGVSSGMEAVDLTELLTAVMEDANYEGMSRQIQVIATTPLPDVLVQANPEMLHRAIENIVRNALKYSPKGGTVELSLSLLKPTTSEKPQSHIAQRCQLRISDQGTGVPAPLLTQIFTPFFRAAGQSNDGYGLGLAIAQRAITAAHGTIEARNLSTGGFEVCVCLPCQSESQC